MRKLALSCLAGLALVGCGSSGDTSFAGNPAQTPVQLTSVVVGRVEVGGAVAGTLVRLVGEDGTVYGSATSDSTGMVYFRNVSVPGNFRAVTRLPGSTVELAAEIQGYGQKRKQARITLLTTLASRYMHSHAGISLTEAESRVKAAARIPAGLDIEIGPLDPNPFYSDFALLRAAGSSGGWEAFSELYMTRAENNQGQLYRLSLDQLDRPIPGLENGLSAVADSARLRMAARLNITQATGTGLNVHYVPTISFISGPVSLGGQFLLGIGTGLGGNVVTAGVNGLIGWAANQMGLNYGTNGQLNEINKELQNLTVIVEGFVTSVKDNSLKTILVSLDNKYADVRTASNATQTQMNNTNITDQPFTPPLSFSTLVTDINAPDYSKILSDTNTTLVGPNQAIMNAQEIVTNQQRGLDRPDSMQNFPWRSNHILDALNPLYGYFAGQQTMALNLLAEQAHNFYIYPDPVPGVTNMLPIMQLSLSSLKRQRQQLPLYTSQWGVLVDYENGIMWWETVFAATDFNTARVSANDFSIPLVMPDGSVRVYDDWRLPTNGEMLSLQNRGKYCPTYDSTVPANGNGSYPDVGHATAGLPALGFYQVGESLSGAPNDNGSNGDLWMDYIQWNGYQTQSLDSFEFRLNTDFDTTSKESKSSDTNCYLMCRTFGPDVLTDPIAKVTQNTSVPISTPPEVAGQAFTDAEIAQFGIPTSLTLHTQAAPATVTYPDPIIAGALRTFTVPSGSVQTVANITYQLFLGGNFTMGYNSTKSFSNATKSHVGTVSTVDSQGHPNELSELVDWSSSDGKAVYMLNIPFASGIAVPLSTTSVNLVATLLGQGGAVVSGQLKNFSASAASPHTLQSIQISPRNRIYGASSTLPATTSDPYFCTGHYADGTMATLATQVTWTVPSNPANAQIVPNGTGVSLELNQPPQQVPTPYNLTITAEYQGKTDTSTIQIVPGVTSNP